MRRKTRCLLTTLLSLSGLCAAAQKPASQQIVTVTVIDVHADKPQPVQAIIVSLSSLDGVSYGNSSTTGKGEAFLHVSADTTQRDDLRIQINTAANSAARDLVIFEPADGQVHGLAQTLPVTLLPKGSPRLADNAHIEAAQRRLSQRVVALQHQVSGMKAQADAQKQAVDAGLEEWARANGLDVQVAQKKVLEWARGIQAQPGVSAERRALAAFALKNYGEAADLFGEATDAEMASLDELKKQQQEQNGIALQKILETTKQQANALQLASRYHDATSVLVKTLNYLSAQHKASPEDGGLRDLWLSAAGETADARLSEGEVSPAGESAGLLAQAIADYQNMQREYFTAGDRQGVARTQMGLGNALSDEGERATGDKAAGLFEQAVQAYRNALEVYTRADLPQDWALTQVNLGVALLDEGERATGDKAAGLLEQAVQAYRNALEVRTKADLPQDWADTQVNLGNALSDEGERATGDKAAGLFEQAVQAYRNALEVDTKADLPQDWARTQMNLGAALDDEGERAAGDKATGLFEQAVQAYRNALEVYTKVDLPQDWARTQMNLGAALDDEGERAAGDKAAGLLEQAVQAYRSALEVDTKADLPQDWADTQMNLGNALLREGEQATGDKAAGLFEQAVQAYRSALEVDTKADLPQDWARAQVNLGSALLDEGERATGDKAAGLFEQAVQAYRNALEVDTKADLPQDWARTMRNLALAYDAQGKADAAREARAQAQAVDPQ